MKIDRLDAHDRLLSLKKESENIQQGAYECKYRNPLSLALYEHSDYIYLFAHKREIGLDEKVAIFQQDIRDCLLNPSLHRRFLTLSDVPHFRILWQPRLTRPEPQENSMLFRAKKGDNSFEVCWIIPQKELWGQNKKGNMLSDDIVEISIHLFRNDKNRLSEPHHEDLPDKRVKQIYQSLKGKKKLNLEAC